MLLNDDYDARKDLREMIESEIERVILFHTGDVAEIDITGDLVEQKVRGDWDPAEITEVLNTITTIPDELSRRIKEEFNEVSKDKERLAQQRTSVIDGFMKFIDGKFGKYDEVFKDEDRFLKTIRMVILRNIDTAWVQHLETMRYLRRSIGLRGYGQRDPLVEYNRESFGVFNAMNQDIEHKVVYSALKILDQSVVAQKAIELAPSVLDRANLQLQGAQKTMERKHADSRTAQKAQRAAAKLLARRTSAKQGPSDAARAKARKKRKKK